MRYVELDDEQRKQWATTEWNTRLFEIEQARQGVTTLAAVQASAAVRRRAVGLTSGQIIKVLSGVCR